MKNELKGLSDPKNFHDLPSLDGIDKEVLIRMLKSMIVIRKSEHQLAKAREEAQGNLEKTEAFYPKHRARRIKDEMENFLFGEIISDQENNSPEAQKLK